MPLLALQSSPLNVAKTQQPKILKKCVSAAGPSFLPFYLPTIKVQTLWLITHSGYCSFPGSYSTTPTTTGAIISAPKHNKKCKKQKTILRKNNLHLWWHVSSVPQIFHGALRHQLEYLHIYRVPKSTKKKKNKETHKIRGHIQDETVAHQTCTESLNQSASGKNGYIHITTHMTLNQQILLQLPPLLLISVMYEETLLYGVVLITGGVQFRDLHYVICCNATLHTLHCSCLHPTWQMLWCKPCSLKDVNQLGRERKRKRNNTVVNHDSS